MRGDKNVGCKEVAKEGSSYNFQTKETINLSSKKNKKYNAHKQLSTKSSPQQMLHNINYALKERW